MTPRFARAARARFPCQKPRKGAPNGGEKPIFNGESFLVAARFDDEYVRENGRWTFRKMSLEPYFMVPLSEGWAGDDKIQMVLPEP